MKRMMEFLTDFFDKHKLMIFDSTLRASVVFLPILIYGFPKGTDIGFHFRWNYYFAEEFRQGNLYPRWLAAANHGYGSPVTLYYAPLQFYVTTALDFLVHDTWRAISLACWLSTALCGATMYVFSRSLLSRVPSLAASLLYMWAPYHLLDLYRGNSLSQYWAYVWIPLVLSSIQWIAKKPGWRTVPYLALSYGLLVTRGDSTITAVNDAGTRQEYSLTARTQSVLTLRPLYFPGWTARVDDTLAQISPSENGHIRVDVPAGQHRLKLTFEDTWPRTIGKLVSALSLITIFGIMYLTRRRRSRRQSGPFS